MNRRNRSRSRTKVGTFFAFILAIILDAILGVGVLPGIAYATDGASAVTQRSEDILADEQERIAGHFSRLEGLLLRMAELSEATDPDRAALLKKVVKQSGDRLVNLQFERLLVLLRDNRLARATENQQQLDDDLRSLLVLLTSENRAKQIASEKARIRQYLKQLSRLIRRQKDLQSRTEETPDPQNLSAEQRRLADGTGRLAAEIEKNEAKDDTADGGEAESRNPVDGNPGDGNPGDGKPGDGKSGDGKPTQGNSQDATPAPPESSDENPTRKQLETARQRMRDAESRLSEARRADATEAQEAAIRELEAAKAKLEEILRQLREEERVRMLAMLQTRFREMLLQQRAVHEATVRLGTIDAADRSHNHTIESRRLGAKQASIVSLADKTLLMLHDDGTAVAFPEAMRQVRDDMQQVATRLNQAKVADITQTIEADIIAALEEMLEALKRAKQEIERQQGKEAAAPGGPSEPSLLDSLAELKMVRALQIRVNRRTERYAELLDANAVPNAELLAALKQLAERQLRIHEVTRDLALGRNQ